MSSSRPPQRVLLTTDTVGGVWNFSLELCRALRPHRVEVLLATMGPAPRPDQRAAAAALTNVALCESGFRLEWMQEPWTDVEEAGEWLLELERHFHPDVIHLNGYAHGALPWLAPVVMTAHSDVCSWWRAVRDEPAPAEWDRYRAAVRAGLASAEWVAAPTQAMLAALQHEHGGLPRAGVVANGCLSNDLAPGRKEPCVLGVGRLWDEAKNAAALAAVAAELPWPVRLAGDSAPPDAGSGAQTSFANVELLGRLPHETLASHYRRAAIYALPARYEPFGLSVLEAAHAGCALVLGDLPSLCEVWGDAAMFVPPAPAAPLAAALQRLIRDDDLRATLGRRARARASLYTAEKMAAGYLDLYVRARESRRSVSLVPLEAHA